MVHHELLQQVSYLRSALEQEKKPIGFLVGAGAPMSIRVNGQPLIPGLEDLTDLVVREAAIELSDALRQLIGHLPEADRRNLEQVLNYIRSLKSLPGTHDVRGVPVSVLADLDADVTRTVRRHVNENLPTSETGYASLAVWISAVRRLAATQIFTTNYDLLMEQALERQRVAYFDGFMGSREPSFDIQAVEEDQLPTRWTLLWKLHGSINWSQDETGSVVRKVLDPSDSSSALVYPSHLKYDQSRRLPYLAMMDRLKAFMRKPGSVLVTTGYSFRDQHINEVLDQSLRANPTASVQGLLFGNLEPYIEATTMAQSLPNLVLIAEDAGVVGTISGPWSPAPGEGDEPPQATRSDLGDFAAFGNFLRNMTGDRLPAGGAGD